jgi:hypothetical protein
MISTATRYSLLEQKHEQVNRLLRTWALVGASLLTLACLT